MFHIPSTIYFLTKEHPLKTPNYSLEQLVTIAKRSPCILKDTRKAFDDFKNKQHVYEVIFFDT